MPNWKINHHGIFESSLYQEISYPETGNDSCFSIEPHSPWFNQRNELILTYLKKYAIPGDFLDIGGGNGFQTKALIDASFNGKVILCEPGVRGCLNAKLRGIDLVYNCYFQDFPFQDYSIFNCGLFDVIEHVDDDIKFLNQLYDKLDKGSRVFVSVPALNALWSETDEYSGHFRRYDLGDLKRITMNTRFKQVNYTYYFSYYIIPLFLIRVIPFRMGLRIGKEKLSIKEQKNLKGGMLDKLFNKLHQKSINKIYSGKRINFGTSLFFILEK